MIKGQRNLSIFYGGFILPVTGNFRSFFHKPFLHREGVDLGYRKAFCNRNSVFVRVFLSGRHIRGFTGAVSAHVCRIGAVTSWVPDLLELRGFESRTPDPGVGSLSWGPQVGGKATMTAETSGVHTKLMPLSGSLDGYEPGSPGPLVGRKGNRFGGKESASSGAQPFPMERQRWLLKAVGNPDLLFLFSFFPIKASF